MSIVKRLILSLMAAALIVSFTACEKEGPLEKAGKKADEAIQKTEDAVKKKTE